MNAQDINRKKYAAVLIGLQIAILLSALDQTVLNIAIPKISLQLNAFDRSAWIITSYLLFSTIATPVSGKLADIYGVKTVLTTATILFTIASALCGCAGIVPQLFGLDAMNQLILLRALQGIGGGAMIGLCFVSIGDLFPARERGKYQGFLAAAFILAAIIGPILGGWLTDAYSWRMIFYLNIPLGIIASLLFGISFPQSSRPKAPASIDYGGIALFVLCIIPLMLAVSGIGYGYSIHKWSIMELVFALLMFAAFIWRESRIKEPLIPIHVFRDRLIAISLITVFITGIGLFGSTLLMATMLQRVIGITTTQSGAALTPLMLIVAGASIIGGWSIAKSGRYKVLCIASLFLMALSSLMLSTLTGSSPLWLLLGYATIGGIGLGLLLPIHTIVIQNAVPGKIMGVTTSMTQFFRSMGGTIGTGIMTALMVALMRQSSLEHAVSQVLLIYSCTVCFAVVLNFFLPELVLKKALPDG